MSADKTGADIFLCLFWVFLVVYAVAGLAYVFHDAKSKRKGLAMHKVSGPTDDKTLRKMRLRRELPRPSQESLDAWEARLRYNSAPSGYDPTNPEHVAWWEKQQLVRETIDRQFAEDSVRCLCGHEKPKHFVHGFGGDEECVGVLRLAPGVRQPCPCHGFVAKEGK